MMKFAFIIPVLKNSVFFHRIEKQILKSASIFSERDSELDESSKIESISTNHIRMNHLLNELRVK